MISCYIDDSVLHWWFCAKWWFHTTLMILCYTDDFMLHWWFCATMIDDSTLDWWFCTKWWFHANEILRISAFHGARYHSWWLIRTCCKFFKHALLFWSIWWLFFLCNWLTAWSQENFLVYSFMLRFDQYILKQIWWHQFINNFIT